MHKQNRLYLIGYACGLAGADIHSGDGPIVLKNSTYLRELSQKHNLIIEWADMIVPDAHDAASMIDQIRDLNERLSQSVMRLLIAGKKCCVIGGDHTSAIGSWNGVAQVYQERGDLGLIWFDAHMDSHTLDTSVSGHLHGMPLACLLGYGTDTLTQLSSISPVLKPENVCLVGVRSFEAGEAALLKKLKVRIFFMDEVKKRGLSQVMDEALQIVSEKTVGFGVSLDLDSIDPTYAPGVDVPEPDGFFVHEFIPELKKLVKHERLLMTEIVEFDPNRDKKAVTEKLLVDLIGVIAQSNARNSA